MNSNIARIEFNINEVEGGYTVSQIDKDENFNLIDTHDFETVHVTETDALNEMEELGRIVYETLQERDSGNTEVEIVYNR